MIIDNNSLFEEFFSEIKDKYPGTNLEEISLICSTPWKFLRDEMGSGKMSKVRFKYLGTFQVYPKRAAYVLSQLDRKLEEKTITKKYYDSTKKILENFIEKEKLNSKEDDKDEGD